MLTLTTSNTVQEINNEIYTTTSTAKVSSNKNKNCIKDKWGNSHEELPDSVKKTQDKVVISKEGKEYFIQQSGAETSSSSTKKTTTSRTQHKGKESFRQFLARAKKQRQEMDKGDVIEEYVKDDYEKAASCQNLIRSRTGLIYDDKMALHECPWDPNYPENPNRYFVILERFRQLGLIERCFELPSASVSMNEITKMHTERLFRKLRLISNAKCTELQENFAAEYDAIYFNDETFNAACLATGCAINLIKAICKGVVQNGMAIIRPPGHHAMNDEYCGYCYFNNVAIGAQFALENNLAHKILIVDFDVHHGQGTQRLFYNDNRVLYFSIHRYEHGKFWPNLRESNYDYLGEGKGMGYNINFPLNVTGLEDNDYLSIIYHILLPVAYEYQPDLIILSAGYDACIGCPEFQPDLIIVSAGFDSAIGDEKGEMKVTPGFYGHLITLLSGLAGGKLAVCLEGGYFLPSLAEGAAMTLKGLLGDPPATLLRTTIPHRTIMEGINNLKIVLHDYWDCFRVFPIHPYSENDPILYKAVIKYEGKPGKAPFLTRDCYPEQSAKHIEKYSKIILDLQNEYCKLGVNQLVSCCYDEAMLLHKSSTHLETPGRLYETYLLYQQWGLDDRCVNLQPKMIDPSIIKRVHKEAYVNQILEKKFEKLIENNLGDMFFNEHTITAIMKAASCLVAVVDSVMKKETQSGVALIRPPGHHATTEQPSGFCFINNVAVAAQYILDTYNLDRILIIDFDIHHGNGTQNIFYESKKVLYLSVHRYEDGKYFPYSTTGNFDCCGKGPGEGFNVNIPMNKDRLSNIDYITIFHRIILPISYSYAPEVILVSAGFDAGIHDSLGNYLVTPDCFGHFIQMLKPLANGKLILALEGGYNPTTVKYSMNICIKTLLGDPLPMLDLSPSKITENTFNILKNVILTQKKYWAVLNVDRKLSKDSKQTEESQLSQQIQKVNIS